MSDNNSVTNTSPTSPERQSQARTGWWSRRSGKGKAGIIGGAVVFVALIAGIVGYGVYYGGGHRALPGTQIGNVSVAGKTHNQIVDYLNKNAQTRQVTFTGDSIKSATASLSDMGISVDADKTADKALANNSKVGKYFAAPFTDTTIEPEVTWDQAKLSAFTSKLTEGVEGAYAAVEPSVTPNSEKTAFTAVAGKNGKGVPLTQVIDGATQAVDANADKEVKVSVGTVEPMVSIKEAQTQADEANKLLANPVSVKVGDNTVTPSAQDRIGWVVIPAVGQANNTPTMNTEKVRAWATDASKSLIVKRIDGLNYVNEKGDVVLEKVKPVDGVAVANTDDITQGIIQAAKDGKAYEAAFTTDTDKAEIKKQVIAPGAENLAYPAAPGEKWIDVNLSNYTTTAFEGATVVHGPVAVVPGATKTPTIQGTFEIQRKLRTDTMRGLNADGSKYVTPDVPYAMYFSGGYALHGAPWRSSFGYGGSAGSHGCVNMPVGEAAWFFNWSPQGTVVVTHY